MARTSNGGRGFQRWEALAPIVDDIQPRTMPLYSEAYSALARGVELLAPDRTDLRLLDLGCGTGTAARTALDVLGLRVASIDLVDGSRAMLDIAGKRLGQFAGRRIQSTLTSLESWDSGVATQIDPKAYDLVISSFALHHLGPDDKRFLFRTLVDLVRPGAGLLMLDLHEVGPLAKGVARLAESALAGPTWEVSVAIGDAVLENLPQSDFSHDRPTTTTFVVESLAELGLTPEILWSFGAFALIAVRLRGSE